jgi:hypothetical protein
MTPDIRRELFFAEHRHIHSNDIVLDMPSFLFWIALCGIAAAVFIACFFAGVYLARNFIGLTGWGLQ